MAMEHIPDLRTHNDYNTNDETSLEKRKSILATVNGCESTPSCGFDCNICLDIVQDPVVTLCGHLYCWPCIYKWIRFQGVSAENPGEQLFQCPACKAEISEKTLIPLYSRGQTAKPSDGKAPHLGVAIPRRPPTPRCGAHTGITTTMSSSPRLAQQLRHRSYPQQPGVSYPYAGSYAATPVLSLRGATTTGFHPMIGMFGEMIYTRIFGNSESTLYTYPDSYHLAGSGSPRVRRQVMQDDKSLSRVCFFLCCCVVLFLFLF